METVMSIASSPLLLPFASLVSYFVFKRFEPNQPWALCLLLFGLPSFIYYISASTSLPYVFIQYWSLLSLFIIAYRLSPAHPLAKYPGPIACKISKFWLAYVASQGKTHEYVLRLHKQYGEVVRIGPNELSITHRDLASSVMSLKGLPRGPYFDTRQHEAGISVDGIRNLAEHATRRRPWTRAMNVAAVNQYVGPMKQKMQELLDALYDNQETSIDLSRWLILFGFDFMGEMALSTDFKMLQHGRDTVGIIDLIQRALKELAWISHIPWILPTLKLFPASAEAWEEMKGLCEKTVMKRIEEGSDRADLIYHLMDEGHNETIAPDALNVSIDGTLAIGAGADTAATALANLWYLLLRHPQYYQRLQIEIDEAFPMGSESMDLSKQAGLRYLNACINESLRLLPPLLAGLQRRVELGTGGKMVGPYFIPEDTQVTPWPYAVHRDPNNFSPLPEVFWPDRWLSQDQYVLPSGQIIQASQVVTAREVFMPFSIGPTICAGKPLANVEMRAVMCAIVQRFKVTVAEDFDMASWEKGLREVFATSRGALRVCIRPRVL